MQTVQRFQFVAARGLRVGYTEPLSPAAANYWRKVQVACSSAGLADLQAGFNFKRPFGVTNVEADMLYLLTRTLAHEQQAAREA